MTGTGQKPFWGKLPKYKTDEEDKLLTTTKYPDKEICKQCKYYKEKDCYGYLQQVVDTFCIDCYSEKVYIITKFEKRESDV